MTVRQALAQFVSDYRRSYPQLSEVFDPGWRSPCELGQPFTRPEEPGSTEYILWEPLARTAASSEHDFAPLERALEITIHPDIKDYYGSFWSGGLEATAPDGHVSLILLWNPADLERLIENLIGHSMAKQRAKSGFSVFFACTEPESELFLSIDNSSGAVLLEKPGYKPVRQVAPDLSSFLKQLVPASPDLHPERAPGVLLR
jgi:SecY interacting protein Syd